MTDVLLALGRRPAARKMAKALKLPLSLPQALTRDHSPWTGQELANKQVLFGGSEKYRKAMAQELAARGAIICTDDAADDDDAVNTKGINVLIYDARGINSAEDLRELYDFFHGQIARLSRCGRVLIVGQKSRPSDSASRAAAMGALEGFGRSLGREIGRYGSTTHTILVAPSANGSLGPLLHFLCTPRPAFSSGQTLSLVQPKQKTLALYSQPLASKVAVITGAGRGIGAATARAYAREGATVIALDRPEDSELLKALCDEIGATPLLCDVTKPEAADQLRQATPGGIDILLHNAGITRDKTIKNMSTDEWDLALAVNLGAVVRISEQLSDHVRDNGRILTLSSIAGIAGNVGQTNYSAAKAGLIGFVKHLGPKLAPRGITVNAVAPGFIETRLTQAIPIATREAARRLSNLSQGGQPEDIAEVLCFLASPNSQGLQGSVWRICGGGFIGA